MATPPQVMTVLNELRTQIESQIIAQAANCPTYLLELRETIVQNINADSTGGSGGSTTVDINPAAIQTATASLTSVAGVATSTLLLDANANRRRFTIFNNSTAALYVNLTGATASTTSFSLILSPGDLYEPSFNYTGAISGIWTAANGNAVITQFLAP